MSSLQASSTGDGTDVTTTSTTQAYLIDYQCVTSHGNETVSDAAKPAVISHYPGKATITPYKYDVNDPNTHESIVHVPVHNPPAMTKPAYLQNILVKFDSAYDAAVDSVNLYYDSKLLVSTNTGKKNGFHIDFSTNEAKNYAYQVPTGISVELDLRFPRPNSAITLYSVTLVYKAT
ncbi:hypothetical protein CJF31_00003917 [Rutstroemia sp. NJR-2017a BVV2]|nr:hypothetical protein CJF31_00003917 [Rutstroemia sp. NJR-2017a BVV2]